MQGLVAELNRPDMPAAEAQVDAFAVEQGDDDLETKAFVSWKPSCLLA